MTMISAWLCWVLRTQHRHCLSYTTIPTSRSWIPSRLQFLFNSFMRTIEESGLLNAPFIITLHCIHSWNTENILLPCASIRGYIKSLICLKLYCLEPTLAVHFKKALCWYLLYKSKLWADTFDSVSVITNV